LINLCASPSSNIKRLTALGLLLVDGSELLQHLREQLRLFITGRISSCDRNNVPRDLCFVQKSLHLWSHSQKGIRALLIVQWTA
jgi:hypothetical protein